MDKEFTPFVDLFASRTAGYLILIDNNQLDWPYFRYLVSGLESKLSRPWMVVVQDSNSTRRTCRLCGKNSVSPTHPDRSVARD
jgi:hypothetical protein